MLIREKNQRVTVTKAIIGLVVLFAVLLSGLGFYRVVRATESKNAVSQNGGNDDPEKYQIADVRDKLKKENLKEGKNLVYEDAKSGLTLWVTAKQGKIINYEFTDQSGRRLGGYMARKKPKPRPKPEPEPETTCWVCVQKGDEIRCVRVPCPSGGGGGVLASCESCENPPAIPKEKENLGG